MSKPQSLSSSSAWAFNLRSNRYDDSSSDSESESCSTGQPSDGSSTSTALTTHSLSEEKRLIDDLDLSTREEAAVYKPNPWSIAKVNAASRQTHNRNPSQASATEHLKSASKRPGLKPSSAAADTALRKTRSSFAQPSKPKQTISEGFKRQSQRFQATKLNPPISPAISSVTPGLSPASSNNHIVPYPQSRLPDLELHIHNDNPVPLAQHDPAHSSKQPLLDKVCAQQVSIDRSKLPYFFASAKPNHAFSSNRANTPKHFELPSKNAHIVPSNSSLDRPAPPASPLPQTTMDVHLSPNLAHPNTKPNYHENSPGSQIFGGLDMTVSMGDATALELPCSRLTSFDSIDAMLPCTNLECSDRLSSQLSPFAEPNCSTDLDFTTQANEPAANSPSSGTSHAARNCIPVALRRFPPSFSSPIRPPQLSDPPDFTVQPSHHSSPPGPTSNPLFPDFPFATSQFRPKRPMASANSVSILRRYAEMVPHRIASPQVPVNHQVLQSDHPQQNPPHLKSDRSLSPLVFDQPVELEAKNSFTEHLHSNQASYGPEIPHLKVEYPEVGTDEYFDIKPEPRLSASSSYLTIPVHNMKRSRSPSLPPSHPPESGAKGYSAPHSPFGRRKVKSPAHRNERGNAYDHFEDSDADASWSTLPSKTRGKAKSKFKRSAPIPLPLALRTKPKIGDITKSGMSAGSKRRVIGFLPKPLLPPKSLTTEPTKIPQSCEEQENHQLRRSPRQSNDTDQAGVSWPTNLRLEDGSRFQADAIRPPMSPTSGPFSGSEAIAPAQSRRYTTNVRVDVADVGRRYPETKRLMTERKRNSKGMWDRLGLESCGTVYRDRPGGHECALEDWEVSIVEWDGQSLATAPRC
ncbi:hypothetical protein HGRIS_000659 [Hohenbuehelia grisea]|uniref:Uncharacterized protein n=1 Tax=Hohenbuehelia grisea TaxID=104357 RepID=A0ABR3JTR5_9AGAR